MANVKIVFCGSEKSELDNVELQCFKNTREEIFISIRDNGIDDDYYGTRFICLDKATAIKLHRELKKQISYIEEGVPNE